MSAYYPGYTYLFASTSNKQEAPYLVRLRKEYIKAVLQDLHDIAHHVYALLENLPETRFAIVRYHDYVRTQIRPHTLSESDSLTIDLFHRHYNLLHESDEFRVRFYKEVFYYEQGFTPHTLEIIYRNYLKDLCENGLRENKPVRLTTDLIRRHGLTEVDASIVGAYVRENNANLAADIQAKYNVLSNLDCIKKEKR